MTREDRELYNRLDSRLLQIETWGERIVRLDEKLTGGNGGGICKKVSEHDRELDEKVSRKEFRWTLGVMGGMIVVGLSLFGYLMKS